MSKLIKLSGKYGEGKFAIIDDEDWDLVSQYQWSLSSRGYVNTKIHYKKVYLHRFVLGLGDFDGIMVDHERGNKLDNRKSKLRRCNNSQNQANTKSWEGKDQKGIYWFRNRWVARIMIDGHRIFLGRFENKEDALQAYQKASIQYFGEFAYHE